MNRIHCSVFRLPFSVLLALGATTFGSADLGLTVSDSPDPVRIGQSLTYRIAVTNSGPDRATNVVVTSILPGSLALGSCSPSVGTWSNDGSTVYANLGNMNRGATAAVVIACTPTLIGVYTNESSVSAVNGSGNRASAVTTVSSANRSPEIILPGPHTLPVGATTSFVVYAQDPDHDPGTTISCTVKPGGAAYANSNFAWTAGVANWNTTNIITFVANDQQGTTNSVLTNSTVIVVPFDADSDAMDDQWEWLNFSTLTNSPAGDRDGDGQDNFSEYVAGTQATNAGSRFVAAGTQASGATRFVISWPTAAGRTYTVYKATNLVQGLQPVSSGLTGGAYTDTVTSLNRAYYQVKVTR